MVGITSQRECLSWLLLSNTACAWIATRELQILYTVRMYKIEKARTGQESKKKYAVRQINAKRSETVQHEAFLGQLILSPHFLPKCKCLQYYTVQSPKYVFIFLIAQSQRRFIGWGKISPFLFRESHKATLASFADSKDKALKMLFPS